MSTTSIDTKNSILSSSFYLGKYYSPNRDAKSSSKRADMSNDLLVSYDGKALKKFAKDITKLSYNGEQSNSADNLKSKINAFVSIYNNYTASAKKSSSEEVVARASKLHSLTKKQAEALSDIGITINSDNTLKISEDLLDSVDEDDLKSLFSNSSSFMKQFKKLTSKLDISV